jgi:uncharacterized Zn-finger protein
LIPYSLLLKDKTMNKAPSAASQTSTPSNAQRLYTVTRADLPVHCPMPGTTLWNSHPRVFLPLEETGKTNCPYCGAEYILSEGQ